MKKIQLCCFLLIAAAVVFLSCNKTIIGRTDNIPALTPSNIDLNAGTWKTVLLGRPDTFPVNAPTPINSSAYVAEINEIKGLQQNITNDQKNIINYWSAGSVLRWNEIMRELVAKYNVAPFQNSDGSYPIPNANNPFATRSFPLRTHHMPQELMHTSA